MKALVTGASGFLGRTIVRQLLAEGATVRAMDRRPETAPLAGAEYRTGDVTDFRAVLAAATGMEVVFHCAARAGTFGDRAEYVRVNVGGTRNVIAACREARVPHLVYTSSPSVVFDGTDLEGVDESHPLPASYHAAYPETKAAAERMVRAASGPGLTTVCIRPHVLFGPGDNHILPRILARARLGTMRRITVHKLIDVCHVENGALAHILAARKLMAGAPIGGRVYFIAQGEPIGMWDFIERLLACAGLPPPQLTISPRLAYALGWALEVVYRLLHIQREPPMTRFVAGELSTAHWFDLAAARRDLGYEPRVSLAQGLAELTRSFERARGAESAMPTPTSSTAAPAI